MKRSPFIEFLRQQGACGPAMRWLRRNGITTYAQAWRRCPQADWLHWLDTTLCMMQVSTCRFWQGRCVRCRCGVSLRWLEKRHYRCTATEYRRKFRRQKVEWLEARPRAYDY